jgi:hypothetical protein
MRAPKASLCHGAGNEISYGQAMVPMGYCGRGYGGTVSAKAALVVIDIEHNTVIYSYLNREGKTGILRRSKIRQDGRGKFYTVRGKKRYIG